MKNKRNKGITLIALVVTIIVLLILAGISIAMLSGNNGILNRAGEARDLTGEKQIEERIQLAYHAALINGQGKITEDLLEIELSNEFGERNTSYTLIDNGTQWEIAIIGTEITENITKSNTDNNTISISTFTIDGGELFDYAEGMKWEEWINSEYNTFGATILDGKIYFGDNYVVYVEDTMGIPCEPSDEIDTTIPYAWGGGK